MEFITMIINGLSIGGTYAMIALGYTMVYGIAKMLNFAHGDVIMVGGYTIVLFFPINPIVGIIASIIFCVVVGIVVEKSAYKPLRGASPLAVLITAIGVSKLLQSAAQIFIGSESKGITFNLGDISLGSVKISVLTLITILCSFAVMVGLTLFVKYTKTGRAMIAVSEDRGAAQLMGINVNFIIMITFIIGSALAAVASAFLVFKIQNVGPVFGAMPGIKAFAAAVIGGIGSIPGAMVGGIVLGFIEAICGMIPAITPYTDAIEFAILIIVLLVKPTGFLGKKRREKV
ncbi:MAG: branched-chain amino acid ABC transporter permease [Clostridia bacterium]|nr:branched-chain amino acid ABC transporter permease [Clostridia bacterium]MBQ9704079.1 branched-chain amino acid ABC transporter permease [Clostridia bacterium]